MKHLFLSILLCFVFSALPSIAVEIGDDAPVITTKDQDGKEWSSKDLLGKKHLVVYFYPAAMTGGCTKQACAYRDAKDDFAGLDTVVVGISGDAPAGLKLFQTVEKLNFGLLSDADGAIAKSFGVPAGKGGSITKTVDGKEHTLERAVTTKRWTFVISKDGKIVHKDNKVKAQQDSATVMAAIKAIK